jgi:hypothetical protein
MLGTTHQISGQAGLIPRCLSLPTFLDSLKKDAYPKGLAIEPTVTTAIFKDMPVKSRLEFYGEFLTNLQTWQQKAMWQQQ